MRLLLLVAGIKKNINMTSCNLKQSLPRTICRVYCGEVQEEKLFHGSEKNCVSSLVDSALKE